MRSLRSMYYVATLLALSALFHPAFTQERPKNKKDSPQKTKRKAKAEESTKAAEDFCKPLVDRAGKAISEKALRSKISKGAAVIYVGEEHARVEHQAFQAFVLEEMAKLGPACLGVEYFPRDLQPILDRFNRGEIKIGDFAEAINWPKVWGHNWESYRPIFEVCAKYKIPVYALNTEKSLVAKVRAGGYAALSPAELLMLPRVDLTREAHKKRVTDALQQVHPMPASALERYYEIFTLWDETMAESSVQAILNDRRPGLRMAVFAGRGHIETGTGIPDRVSRSYKAARLVIVCGSETEELAEGNDLTLRSPTPRAKPRLY
jgi:uncharacterized iron-regulated protein